MFQKICNYLSILSTVLVLGILGGGFFTFKYVTSEQFKAKMMNEVLGNVKGLMPKVLADTNKNILMIEGGIQAKEMLLKKIESASQQSNKAETKKESKTEQPNS